MKKPKKPNLPKHLKRSFRRSQAAEEKVSEALRNVPRITNETVAEHREEVLGSARKYIYPLQHSKHHVVRISVGLLLAALVIFLGIISLELYKFQATSGFVYDVVRVIPFPVAKAGDRWISYESYLFELRHNMHYYRTQQSANFSTRDGKAQLQRLRQQAMNQVVQDAYVKELAGKNNVSVSGQSVNNEVALVRSQNRLGSNDRVFKDVLNEFWGWSIDDFKRELRQQMLQQAVVAKLDSATNQRAQAAFNQLKSGTDFAKLAGEVSEDPATKGSGGQYGDVITPTNRNIAPLVSHYVFQLKPGQTSGVVNTGYTLEIVKVLDASGNNRHAAHIQFNFKDISVYTDTLLKQQPPRHFIKV
jgi:hypothetical protein